MSSPLLQRMLGGFDAAKLALDSLPGLILMTSLLFFIDALAPASLAKGIFEDPQAGVLSGLLFIVGSATLGILLDSFFQTFGRWFAKKLDYTVDREYTYRDDLMLHLGLETHDFEWVKSTGPSLEKEVENKFMRFIEVAGSSAYALLLAAPAVALFLSREHGLSHSIAGGVAAAVATAAVALIFTSARSLGKYEERKTAAALDEIRKLGRNPVFEKKAGKAEWWSFIVAGLFGAAALAFGAAALAAALFALQLPETREGSMILIGKAQNEGIPVLELEVRIKKDAPATPANRAGSLLVLLNDQVRTPVTLSLGVRTELVSASWPTKTLETPEWKLYVSIASLGEVREGDAIAINALLSFDKEKQGVKPEGQPGDQKGQPPPVVPVGKVGQGDWQFPVVVEMGTKGGPNLGRGQTGPPSSQPAVEMGPKGGPNLGLLAFVKVTIKWEGPPTPKSEEPPTPKSKEPPTPKPDGGAKPPSQ